MCTCTGDQELRQKYHIIHTVDKLNGFYLHLLKLERRLND